MSSMNKKLIIIPSLIGLSFASFGFALLSKNAMQVSKADSDFVVYENGDLGLVDYGDVLTYDADGVKAYINAGELSAKSELHLQYKNSSTANQNYWIGVGGYAAYVSTSSTMRFLRLETTSEPTGYSRIAAISNLVLKADNGTALTSVMPNNKIFNDFVNATLRVDTTGANPVIEYFVEYQGVTYYPYSSDTKISSYTFTTASGITDHTFRIGTGDGTGGKMVTFKPESPIPNEFTNNGQFAYSGSYNTLIVGSKCSAEGVPSGNVGSVLRVAGLTADDGTYNMSFDFTPGAIKLNKIESIVFRIYAEATVNGTYPEFRLSVNGGWGFNGTGDFAGAGGYSLKTVCNQWYDLELSPTYFINGTTWNSFASTSDNTILGVISPMLRVKHGTTDKFYFDSVTVYINDSVDEFTNDGQFNYSILAGAELYSAYQASAHSVPAGYTGAVMKMGGVADSKILFDFSSSQIPLALVNNIRFKVYASGSPNGNYPEFRIQNPDQASRGLDLWPYQHNGGAGGYSLINEMNQWINLDVNASTLSGQKMLNLSDITDPTLLGQFRVHFRTNDTTNILYIDSVIVTLAANDGVGPVIDFNQSTIHIPANTKPVLPTTAFDAQDNRNVPINYNWDVTPTFDGEGKITSQGTYALTMSAEDYYHNVTNKAVTIIVDAPDTTGPAINIPFSEITLPVGTIFDINFRNYITDEYEFTYTTTYSEGAVDGMNRLLAGNHTLTIRAEDYSGNVSQKVITIHAVNDYYPGGDVIDEEKIASDYLAVEQFCITYLKKGTIPTSDNSNTGACLSYYADAKAAYEALTADQKAIFLNASEYADMVARLTAWANANQEAFVGGEFINAANGLNINQNNINLLAMIAITSIVISLSGLLIVAALRKRKKQ